MVTPQNNDAQKCFVLTRFDYNVKNADGTQACFMLRFFNFINTKVVSLIPGVRLNLPSQCKLSRSWIVFHSKYCRKYAANVLYLSRLETRLRD